MSPCKTLSCSTWKRSPVRIFLCYRGLGIAISIEKYPLWTSKTCDCFWPISVILAQWHGWDIDLHRRCIYATNRYRKHHTNDAGPVSVSRRRRAAPGLKRSATGMRTCRSFWRRESVLKSGTVQSSPARRNMLSTIPVACRSARPKRHLMVRPNCMAASKKVDCRPRLSVAGANQFMPLSSQRRSCSRCLRDWL